ncbi:MULTISPECIES: signal peptidase I [Streptomyces]|uniref:Signal peptidase I n=1 Tax=Streptomyces solicathayae TaxID=3081768 RepID=A0ABZ0M4V2_9ACTN|nr:signal peptidase I [Streptomyces sp. HUAS YS2]WOX26098.1 signal peptidase I [Streptomyces sp. HUAS YS2]
MTARRVVGGLFGAALVLAAVGVAAVLTLSVRVDGHSMEPTLRAGERLLAAPDSGGEVRRFDVVLLRPAGREALVVKRVIGVPGDRVGIVSTPQDPYQVLLQIGGAGPTYRVTDPAWTERARRTGNCCSEAGLRSARPEMRTVPAGAFFFLGDNPDLSDDSRAYGWGDVRRVTGRVALRVWPLAGPHELGNRPGLVPVHEPVAVAGP